MKKSLADEVRQSIRSIPDFPKKGILFRDITPLLLDGDKFRRCIDWFASLYEKKPDYVIILAPLYADIIMKKNQEYLKQGGKFLLFWPEFKVIEEAAAFIR